MLPVPRHKELTTLEIQFACYFDWKKEEVIIWTYANADPDQHSVNSGDQHNFAKYGCQWTELPF